jgi:hypothetical protein
MVHDRYHELLLTLWDLEMVDCVEIKQTGASLNLQGQPRVPGRKTTNPEPAQIRFRGAVKNRVRQFFFHKAALWVVLRPKAACSSAEFMNSDCHLVSKSWIALRSSRTGARFKKGSAIWPNPTFSGLAQEGRSRAF